jgi:DNA polymerase III, gamma/tau subunits
MDVSSSNAQVAAALRQMAESGRIPHAMLFHENDGGGAFPLIIDFLDEVYGHNPRVKKLIHPDVHFVFPVAGPSEKKPVSDQFLGPWRELLQENPCFFENELYAAIGIEGKQGLISVNEARSILDKLSLSAVEGGYRTVVMYLPEKMNQQAANALLKMIEEPPENTLFLLVTLQPEKVMTTIFSRCLFMRVLPFSREEDRAIHAKEEAETTEFADLFHDLLNAVVRKDLLGALETADAVADLGSREKQKRFCKIAGEGLRNIFLLQQGLPDLADILGDERPFYEEMAAKLRKTFSRQALAALDRALLLLERNVNQKILFTDLVNRLYMTAL